MRVTKLATVLCGPLLFIVGGSWWCAYWGYEWRYFGASLAYLFGVLLLPGALLALLSDSELRRPSELIPRAVIYGTALLIADYLVAQWILTPRGTGTLILATYGAIGSALAIRSRRQNLRAKLAALSRLGRTEFPATFGLALAFCGLAAFAALSVYHVNPETWPGRISFHHDFGWHLGIVNSMVRQYRPTLADPGLDLLMAYHFLAHMVAAHMSLLFRLHPSHTFLQGLPPVEAVLLVLGVACFLVRQHVPRTLVVWGVLLLLFGVAPFPDQKSRYLALASSFAMGMAYLFHALAIVAPNSVLADRRMRFCVPAGLALGLATVAKGSLGIALVVAFGCCGLLGAWRKRVLFCWSFLRAGIVMAVIWVLLYGLFFFVPMGQSEAGGVEVAGIRSSVFDIHLADMALAARMFGWRWWSLAALLFPIPSRLRGPTLLVVLFSGIGATVYASVSLSANSQLWFWQGSLLGFEILIILGFSSLWRQKILQPLAIVCLPVLLLCAIYDNRVLQALLTHPRRIENVGARERNHRLDRDLYTTLSFVRDHTPAATILVHALLQDVGTTTSYDDLFVSGFSERPAYSVPIHALGFQYTGSGTPAHLSSVTCEAIKERRARVSVIFSDAVAADNLAGLAWPAFTFLGEIGDINRLRTRFPERFTALYENGKFGVLALKP